jgi:hypothetical protein
VPLNYVAHLATSSMMLSLTTIAENKTAELRGSSYVADNMGAPGYERTAEKPLRSRQTSSSQPILSAIRSDCVDVCWAVVPV